MPAKKTFPSIRVRGPASLEVAPLIEGQTLVDYVAAHVVAGDGVLRYRARVSGDGGGGLFAVEPLNSLGVGVVWGEVDASHWQMQVDGAVAWDRALAWASVLDVEGATLVGVFNCDGERAPGFGVWDLRASAWFEGAFDGLNVFVDVVPE
jgi:hypothetical protein